MPWATTHVVSCNYACLILAKWMFSATIVRGDKRLYVRLHTSYIRQAVSWFNIVFLCLHIVVLHVFTMTFLYCKLSRNRKQSHYFWKRKYGHFTFHRFSLKGRTPFIWSVPSKVSLIGSLNSVCDYFSLIFNYMSPLSNAWLKINSLWNLILIWLC